MPMFFLPYPKVDDTDFSISFHEIKASGRSFSPVYLYSRIVGADFEAAIVLERRSHDRQT